MQGGGKEKRPKTKGKRKKANVLNKQKALADMLQETKVRE